MAKGKKVKTEKAKLTEVTVFCPKLDKNVKVVVENCSFSGRESECDLCGSHGSFEVVVDCECGNDHKICLNSW